jgi:flagellar assembly factor FliW
MQSEKIDVLDEATKQHHKSIFFPDGLPAFESVREFVIISNEEEAPFIWLQAVSTPNLAFVTIDPFLVYPEYRPDIGDDDVKKLKIENEEDVLILGIVNISNDPAEGITTNLVGPVVINWKMRLGKQVVLQNHGKYSVRYRIDNLEEPEEEVREK